jgi:hypothetical protein
MKKNLSIINLMQFIVLISVAHLGWDAQAVSINSVPARNLPCSNIFTGSLPSVAGATLNLGNVVFPYFGSVAAQVLKGYTVDSSADQHPKRSNDNIAGNISVKILLPGPVSESFEGTLFPPEGWNIVNPNAGSITWARTVLAAKTGSSSVRMFFFNYAGVGHVDFLQSPVLDAAGFDTAIIIFNRAYRKYDASTTFGNDTLLIQLSTDLGITFPVTVWKKGGADLATNPITTTANYVPVSSDWLPDTIKYVLPSNTDNFSISFVGKNGFGQNLYLDDITIQVKKPVVALPVSLLLFNLQCRNNLVRLNWKTAGEENSSHFIVEKIVNGEPWAGIATIPAAGNTSSEKDYLYTDKSSPQTALYRLAQYDINGAVHYSGVLRASCEVKELFIAWPNPVNDKLFLSINTNRSSRAIVSLFSSSGALVKKTGISFISRHHTICY